MATSKQSLTGAGLVRAITSLMTNATERLIPDGNFKALISILAGMIATLLVFEVMSWYALQRIRAKRRQLENVLTELHAIRTQANDFMAQQIEAMKNFNASRQSIRTVETDMNAFLGTIASAVSRLNRKTSDIIDELEV